MSIGSRQHGATGRRQEKAHIVGGGFGGLAAAAYLIRDAGMSGQDITIYKARERLGGAHLLLQVRTRTLDGTLRPLFERWHPGLADDNAADTGQTA